MQAAGCCCLCMGAATHTKPASAMASPAPTTAGKSSPSGPHHARLRLLHGNRRSSRTSDGSILNHMADAGPAGPRWGCRPSTRELSRTRRDVIPTPASAAQDTTPLNAQRPHERWWRPLKPTWPIASVLGRHLGNRQRSGMPEGTCGAAARSIAVRVLPVATRLATATAGKTSPRTITMLIIRFMICSGGCQPQNPPAVIRSVRSSLTICVCVSISAPEPSHRTSRPGSDALRPPRVDA